MAWVPGEWAFSNTFLYKRKTGQDPCKRLVTWLANVSVSSADSKGYIWVGTRQHGVHRLTSDPRPSSTLHFDERKGLMSNWTKAITEDKKGNIWLISFQGLDKLVPKDNSYRVLNFSKLSNYYSAGIIRLIRMRKIQFGLLQWKEWYVFEMVIWKNWHPCRFILQILLRLIRIFHSTQVS